PSLGDGDGRSDRAGIVHSFHFIPFIANLINHKIIPSFLIFHSAPSNNTSPLLLSYTTILSNVVGLVVSYLLSSMTHPSGIFGCTCSSHSSSEKARGLFLLLHLPSK